MPLPLIDSIKAPAPPQNQGKRPSSYSPKAAPRLSMAWLQGRRVSQRSAARMFGAQSSRSKYCHEREQEHDEAREFKTLPHLQRRIIRQERVEKRADERRQLRGGGPARQKTKNQQHAADQVRRDDIMRRGHQRKRHVRAAV